MVAKVVPHDELLAEARRMAQRIALVPSYAVEMTKESLRRTYEIMGFRNALQAHRIVDTAVLGGGDIPDPAVRRSHRAAGGDGLARGPVLGRQYLC